MIKINIDYKNTHVKIGVKQQQGSPRGVDELKGYDGVLIFY